MIELHIILLGLGQIGTKLTLDRMRKNRVSKLNIQDEIIPYTLLNEQIILSLLDKYIDVTGISFGALATIFSRYTDDTENEVLYHGRQVSYYMKRERSISRAHWYGIIEFVYSSEFIESIPEARIVLRQKEASIESAIYFANLYGFKYSLSDFNEFIEVDAGLWSASEHSFMYIQNIAGYSFTIVHGTNVTFNNEIWSGFLFPHDTSEKDGLFIRFYAVYLWNRLTRKPASAHGKLLVFLGNPAKEMQTQILFSDKNNMSLDSYQVYRRNIPQLQRITSIGESVSDEKTDNGKLKTLLYDQEELEEGEKHYLKSINDFLIFIDKSKWSVIDVNVAS